MLTVSRTLCLCWLALVLMSLISVGLGAQPQRVAVTLVLLLALFKSWLISERFMALRNGPRYLRGLLLFWPVPIVLLAWLLH